MAPKVNVWSGGKWYGPSYPDAGGLPAGRTVSNDSGKPERVLTREQAAAAATALHQDGVLSREEAVRDVQRPVPPPKAGAGSSRAKWAAYATEQSVEFDDDATRDDIIDACHAAGVPVE